MAEDAAESRVGVLTGFLAMGLRAAAVSLGLILGGCGGSTQQDQAEWGVGEQPDIRSCEVVLTSGLLKQTAHVEGMRSTVRRGLLGNDAVIEGGEVKMETGAVKQVIGEFSEGKTWYREGPLRSEVPPVRGGSTTISRGLLKYTVTSSGCNNGQVYLGALHLVAFEHHAHPAQVWR